METTVQTNEEWKSTFNRSGLTRVGLWAHHVARGCTTRDAFVGRLRARMLAKIRFEDHRDDAAALLALLDAGDPGLLQYLELIFAFVQLPQADQDHWRGAVAWQKRCEEPGDGVTEKQLRYLAYLGYQGNEPTNRKEASQLINEMAQPGRA